MSSWNELMSSEFNKSYMQRLKEFLIQERASHTVYPPTDAVFQAFCETPFDQVKIVIIGQDPYHGEKQAHGLSFSVPKGIVVPPSLKNIFKELQADVGIPLPTHGCLTEWAKQGVLLLNATLTVRANEAKSHYGQGWEEFTNNVVDLLYAKQDPIVFLLWGKSAIQYARSTPLHLVLTAPHPSPLSAHTGFLGCRHFSQANAFLKKQGKSEINWSLSP